MKKNILILLVACTMGLLWSCKKDLKLVNAVSTTEGLAFIKIIDASPNFRNVFKGADSFNIYVNGVKINGSQLTYNSVFPAAIANLYAGVPAGPQSIRITVNGKLTPDSITLGSLNKTLDAGSYYSFIITDEALGANEARQMFIKDNFALVDTNNFTVRFVNAVLNDAGPVDVYSFRRAANIFTNVAPATATPFVNLSYTLPTSLLSDTLYVRATGTLTDIAKVTVNASSAIFFNRGRAYTLLYKGQFGVTGTKARALILYTNN